MPLEIHGRAQAKLLLGTVVSVDAVGIIQSTVKVQASAVSTLGSLFQIRLTDHAQGWIKHD